MNPHATPPKGVNNHGYSNYDVIQHVPAPGPRLEDILSSSPLTATTLAAQAHTALIHQQTQQGTGPARLEDLLGTSLGANHANLSSIGGVSNFGGSQPAYPGTVPFRGTTPASYNPAWGPSGISTAVPGMLASGVPANPVDLWKRNQQMLGYNAQIHGQSQYLGQTHYQQPVMNQSQYGQNQNPKQNQYQDLNMQRPSLELTDLTREGQMTPSEDIHERFGNMEAKVAKELQGWETQQQELAELLRTEVNKHMHAVKVQDQVVQAIKECNEEATQWRERIGLLQKHRDPNLEAMNGMDPRGAMSEGVKEAFGGLNQATSEVQGWMVQLDTVKSHSVALQDRIRRLQSSWQEVDRQVHTWRGRHKALQDLGKEMSSVGYQNQGPGESVEGKLSALEDAEAGWKTQVENVSEILRSNLSPPTKALVRA